MNNRFKLLSLIMSGALVVACGNQAGSSSSQASPGPVVNDVKPQIALDQISVLPVATGANPVYLMRVNNFTTDAYDLISVKVTDMDEKKDKSGILKVTAPVGAKVPANTSVMLNLEPKTNKSTDLLLTVQVKKMGGGTETLRQIIRLSDSVKSPTGIASYNDLGTIVTADNNYGLAVPFVLEKDFTNVKSINGEVNCKGQQYTKGNSCTLLVKGKLLGDSRYVNTDIVGYIGDKEVTRSNGGSTVRFAQEGNLLISHGVSIRSANGTDVADIILYNNGTADATVASIEAALGNNSKLVINGGGCLSGNGNISPGRSCNIVVSAQSDTSSFEGINVGYTASSNKNVSTTVLYHGITNGVTLVPSITGSLLDTIVRDSKTVTITLDNYGSAALTGMDIRVPASLSRLFAIENNQCGTATLGVGQNCTFQVKYNPEQETPISTLDINIQGKYANSNMIYHYGVPYSAIPATDALSMEEEPGSGTDFFIPANSTIIRTQNFIIKNQASQTPSATLGDFTSRTIIQSTPATAPVGFADANILVDNSILVSNGVNPCATNNQTLAAQEMCRFAISYGNNTGGLPEHTLNKVTLNVPFSIPTVTGLFVQSPVLSFFSTTGPLVNIDSADIRVFSSDGTATNTMMFPDLSPFTLNRAANGLSNSPYSFVPKDANSYFAITYTLRNLSTTEAANNFNVGNLHYLGEIITQGLTDGTNTVVPATTCPYGISVRSLDPTDSCIISLKLPRREVTQGNINNASVNQFLRDSIEIAPELSYTNANNEVMVHRSGSFNRYFNYDRSWVNLDIVSDNANAQYNRNINLWEITYTVSLRNFPLASVSEANIDVKVDTSSNITTSDLNNGNQLSNCTLSATTSTCPITFQLNPDKFAVGMNIPVIFEITGPTGSGVTPIEIKRSFGLANWSSNP